MKVVSEEQEECGEAEVKVVAEEEAEFEVVAEDEADEVEVVAEKEADYDLASLAPSVPPSLRKLCLWGEIGFNHRRVINFTIEDGVFQQPRKAMLDKEDVYRISSMSEITGNCIAVYER